MLNLRRYAVATALIACAVSGTVRAQVARTNAAVSTGASPRSSAAALNPAANPEALGFDAQRLAKLDAYMAKAVADGRVSGMSTLLARHGQVVSEKIYGARRLEGNVPMTRDTIFRLYSMTKPITGVAMMILFEEGKWRLDDPVTRFVPEFKDLKVFTGTDAAGQLTVEPMKRPPTMREIMSHSAGFGYGLGDRHPVDKLYREKSVLSANGLAD